MGSTGLAPENWKVDLISFLYKRKGGRADPKSWRPITIAVSLGKLYEKVILYQIRRITNANNDNHAYVKGRSCLSAIIDVMEFLKAARGRKGEYREKGLKLVPLILTEDISGAFSIDHGVIDSILKHRFNSKGDFDVRGAVASYLDREVWASRQAKG